MSLRTVLVARLLGGTRHVALRRDLADHVPGAIVLIGPGLGMPGIRRADGLVVGETSPRGTAGQHELCQANQGAPDQESPYAPFTTRYEYHPTGELCSRSAPFAPDQYRRSDSKLSQWQTAGASPRQWTLSAAWPGAARAGRG